MKTITESGIITMNDLIGITYSICRLDYILNEDGTFRYIFTPDYEMIASLPDEFQGIPGLNLDLHKQQYVREDRVPVFLTERTPPENRVDLWNLLSEVGMDYYDRMEWLLRTTRRYPNDNLHMIRVPEKLEPITFDKMSYKSARLCKTILQSIAEGRKVSIDGMNVTNENRPVICNLLRSVLHSEKRYNFEHPEEKCHLKGRKRIEIGEIDLEYVKMGISRRTLTIDKAAKELGVSRATLYRRLKQSK